jgi:hypothetical protein
LLVEEGVSVGPGQIQLTVIWYRAISRASDRVAEVPMLERPVPTAIMVPAHQDQYRRYFTLPRERRRRGPPAQ